MGRRRTYMNNQTRRALSKLDPSGCITFTLIGLGFFIAGIVFLFKNLNSIAMPIIGIILGIIFIVVGIFLGVKYYKATDKSNNDSDYKEF